MRLARQWLPLYAGVAMFALASCSPVTEREGAAPEGIHDFHRLIKRQAATTDPTDIAGKTYDYVIVGAGIGGLVTAMRLTENPAITVAVIEAGGLGDDVAASVNIPFNAYFSSLTNTQYDWQYNTTQQTGLNNRAAQWPRGKIVGGSTALNGMYYNRASSTEYDPWVTLFPGSDWNWAGLLPYFKKAETYVAASTVNAQAFNISHVDTYHGTTGPVYTSFPEYIFYQTAPYLQALEALGLPHNGDPASGDATGAYVMTSTLNPYNQTRSYARSAYFDPYIYRPNLNLLTGYLVTNISWASTTAGNLTASGVNFASDSQSQVYNVQAKREVILAGGSINTPQILQLSGVGPSAVLKDSNIPVLINLPGVGQNLQDHLSTQLVFTSSATEAAGDMWSDAALNASEMSQYQSSRTGYFTYANDAIGYPNMGALLGAYLPQFLSEVKSNLTYSASQYNFDPTVLAGLNQQYDIILNNYYAGAVGQCEILLSLSNGKINGVRTLAIQVAMQHPLSRGNIQITSSNPFDTPNINPNYLTNLADIEIVRAGLQFARKLSQTAPLSNLIISEYSPGTGVQSNQDWDTWAANNLQTEYHPAGTCAMLPLASGGVVDTKLKVYGTSNVRVIDSSIIPLHVSAHLMATTYALAEKGADIVKAAQVAAVSSSSSLVSSSTSSSSAASSSSASSPVRLASNTPSPSSTSVTSTSSPAMASNHSGASTSMRLPVTAAAATVSIVLVSMVTILAAIAG